MLPKAAVPAQFYLRSGDSLIQINGWESSYVLGIYRSDTALASCMLMSGLLLVDGFDTLKQAHAFNLSIHTHPKIFVGTPFLDEMFARAGGRDEAQKIILQLKAKAMKENSA